MPVVECCSCGEFIGIVVSGERPAVVCRECSARVFEEIVDAVDLRKVAPVEFSTTEAWNQIRKEVLERDQYTCRVCGAVGETSFHVHHIMKRSKGGTDHADNLVTVCPKCHRKADGELYDPDWTQPPNVTEDTECDTKT